MKGYLGVSVLLVGALFFDFAYGAPSKLVEKSKDESLAVNHEPATTNADQSTSLSAEPKSSMESALAPAPEMSESHMEHETPAPKSPARTSMSIADRMKARREQLALLGLGAKKAPESSVAIVKIPKRTGPSTLKKEPTPEQKPVESAETSARNPDKESSPEGEHHEPSFEGKIGRSMQHGRKFSNRRSSTTQNTWSNKNNQQSSPSTSSSHNGNSNPSTAPAAPSKSAHSRTPMRRNQSPTSSSASWNSNQNNAPAAAPANNSPAQTQKSSGTSSGKRTWGSRKAKEMPTLSVSADDSSSSSSESADNSREARNMKMPSTRNMMMVSMMNKARSKRSPNQLHVRRTLVADYKPSQKNMREVGQQSTQEVPSGEKSTEVVEVKKTFPSGSESTTTVKETAETSDLSTVPQVAGGVVSSDLPVEKHDEQVVKKVFEKEVTPMKKDEDEDAIIHTHSENCQHSVQGDVVVLPKTDVEKTVTVVRRTQSFSSSDEPLIEQYHLQKDNTKPVASRNAEKPSVKVEEPKKEEVKDAAVESKKSTEPKVPETSKPAVPIEEEAKKNNTTKLETTATDALPTTTTTTTMKPVVTSTATPKESNKAADAIDAATQKEVDAELAQSVLNLTGAMDPIAAQEAAAGKNRRKRNTPSIHMTNLPARNSMMKPIGQESNGMPGRNMPMMRRRRSTGYGYQQKARNSVRSSSGSGYNMETVSVRITSDPIPAVRSTYEAPATPAVRSTYEAPATRSSYGRSLLKSVTPAIRSSNYETPAIRSSNYETPAIRSSNYETPAIRSSNYETPAVQTTYEAPATPAIRTSTYEDVPAEEPYETPMTPSSYIPPAPEVPAATYSSGSNAPTRFAARGRSLQRSAPLRSDSQMYSGSAAAPAEESHSTPTISSTRSSAHPVRSSLTRSSSHPVRHAVRTSSSAESDISLEEIRAALKSIRSSKAHTKSLSVPLRSAQRSEAHQDTYESPSLFDEVDTTNYAAPAPVSPSTRAASETYSSPQDEAVIMDEETYSQPPPQPPPSRKLPIRISKERYRRSAEKSENSETPSPAPQIKDFDDTVLAKLGEKRPAPMKPTKHVLATKTSTKSV